MVCSKCGKANEDNARFCIECGAELQAAEEVEAASTPEEANPTEEAIPAEANPTEEAIPAEANPSEEAIPSEANPPTGGFNPAVTTIAPQATTPKKSVFKKWWFWALLGVFAIFWITIVSIIIASIFGGGSSSSSSYSYSAPVVSPYVTMVKTAKNSTYGVTYGAAFNSFFSNPKWSHFTSSEGLEVVEFEGGFSYSGSPAKAKFQFVVDVYEGSFQIYHLSINGESQSKLMLATFVKKVFESY